MSASRQTVAAFYRTIRARLSLANPDRGRREEGIMSDSRASALEERFAAVEAAETAGVSSAARATVGLAIAFALLFAIKYGPPLPGLKPEAQAVLGVFAWFITVMVTDALPKAVVGLAAPLLVVLFAGVQPGVAFRAFSTDIWFLGVGAFVIAGIMIGTPLGKRIALKIVTAMRSNKVTRIQTGLGVADIAVGSVLPTVSETALFLPVTKAIGTLMRGKEHLDEVRRINTALLLQTPGLTPLFTGTLILTSHFPNIMLVGQLKSSAGINVSWLDWLWLNLPLWGLLPIMFWYVFSYFKLWKLAQDSLRHGRAHYRGTALHAVGAASTTRKCIRTSCGTH
jgi:sodium-dependent dicarboxylate transporter 2/3/5